MTEHYDNHPGGGSNPGGRSDDARTKQIAKEGAHEAVNEAFERLGIDPDEWHEMQKDTAFLRKLRENCDGMTRWISRGVVTIVLTFVAGVIIAAFKFKYGK